MTIPHDSDNGRDKELSNRQHQVVVFGIPDDPHQLRDLLTVELGINATDAQIQVHNLPGVLPAALPTHRAAKLAEAIRSLGVNATAIPSEEVPVIGKVDTVHHLRCNDQGIEILDHRGELQTAILWQDVALLSVGYVPHESQHQVGPAATLVTQLATSHRSEQPTSVPHDSLDLLIVVENPPRAYRIDHAKFNYHYLGGRMSTSATVNFRWLIQDLVNHAASASLTPATRSFLEHGLARHYQFGSGDEMRRYTIFHLIIRATTKGAQREAAREALLSSVQVGSDTQEQSRGAV